MATMILPAEASGVRARPADAVLDIMHDTTLSMGEKLLLIEGLFVHDRTPEPASTDLPYFASAFRRC
jgi:hypothetical protein